MSKSISSHEAKLQKKWVVFQTKTAGFSGG
jgi:hypothetical protein